MSCVAAMASVIEVRSSRGLYIVALKLHIHTWLKCASSNVGLAAIAILSNEPRRS